jgi:hypothetical protein
MKSAKKPHFLKENTVLSDMPAYCHAAQTLLGTMIVIITGYEYKGLPTD